MFLEAQFGADALTPIAIPKLLLPTPKAEDTTADEASASDSENEDDKLEASQRAEIERLHKLGIPVPGVEVKVDKMVAKVWLEDLEVECVNRVFGDRVRAVVERAVEVAAPLWA